MICFVFFLLRDIINMCIVACFSLFLFIRRGHGIDWPCQALPSLGAAAKPEQRDVAGSPKMGMYYSSIMFR